MSLWYVTIVTTKLVTIYCVSIHNIATSLTDDERCSIKNGLKINNINIEDTAASLLSIVEVIYVLIY